MLKLLNALIAGCSDRRVGEMDNNVCGNRGGGIIYPWKRFHNQKTKARLDQLKELEYLGRFILLYDLSGDNQRIAGDGPDNV